MIFIYVLPELKDIIPRKKSIVNISLTIFTFVIPERVMGLLSDEN
jgi:hypothetical protein